MAHTHFLKYTKPNSAYTPPVIKFANKIKILAYHLSSIQSMDMQQRFSSNAKGSELGLDFSALYFHAVYIAISFFFSAFSLKFYTVRSQQNHNNITL